MLILLRGATNSFKTTFANRFFSDISILSIDNVRHMLFGSYYYYEEEALVSRYFYTIIRSRIKHGLDTIIDSTNLHADHMKQFINTANRFEDDYIIVSLRRDVKEAVDGSLVRGTPLLSNESIRKQHSNYDKYLPEVIEKYGDHFYEFVVTDEESLDDIYLEYKQIVKIRNKDEAILRSNKESYA